LYGDGSIESIFTSDIENLDISSYDTF